MKTIEKRLFEVFKSVRLPADMPPVLKNATVKFVRFAAHEKRIDVGVCLDEILAPHHFEAMEEAIAAQLDMLESVDIIAAYTPDGDASQILKTFRENLHHRLRKTSPFLFEIVAHSKYSLTNDTLCFALPSDITAMLRKMNAAAKIENILAECVNLHLKVSFECTPQSRKPQETRDATRPAPVATGAAKPKPKAQKPAPPKQKVAGEARPLDGVFYEDEAVVVEGRVFRIESREIKNKKLLYVLDITDGRGSMTVKYFVDQAKAREMGSLLAKDAVIKAAGQVQFDKYSNELNILANKLGHGHTEENNREDNAPTKRVELHLHTNMSALDAITPAADFIKRAAGWGHKAVAITDHGVVQAFPDAMDAAKKAGIKLIYGVEAYLVDDLALTIATRPGEYQLDDDFIVFDFETTGLNPDRCTIIEIGAVRMRGGAIVDSFSRLINPQVKLPSEIVELTHITDDMLQNQPTLDLILPQFLNFIGDTALVAHNADFDMGFLEHHAKLLGHHVANPYICTLQLSRALYPALARHGLAAMAKHHGVNLENHHRAEDDAAALAKIFAQELEILKSQQIVTLNHINLRYSKKIDIKSQRSHHAVILVKNRVGLRNLYELISKSHLNYYHRHPRIPKSEFLRHREGLLIGTACDAGEFFKAVLENRPEEQIETLAEFYDYFEIHPLANHRHLVVKGDVEGNAQLEDINRKILAYGRRFGKPVVAAGDAHFLDPGQEVYRAIIMAGNGFKDADDQPPLHFQTTEEMLANFAYLGEADAHAVVVENTNLIADMIENFPAIPDGTFPPVLAGSDDELIETVTRRAKEIYGDPMPEIVQTRMDREMQAIIGNGFSVMYVIAHKLVAQSMDNGYLVGSRGSIGSSFVATMADITEVNPLSPHYYCLNCKFTDFDSDIVKPFAGASGCDMPDRNCPTCGEILRKDGHSIPFETFLGFDGDKEPDIDLNFSGEYQAAAHAYAEELFGSDYIFKAGTISTIAERTAFGYVKKYLEERGQVERAAEVNRLVAGCTGIKRTTGQHPGGLMVVPHGKSIYDFTPVQRPANDANSDVITTHFDYHSISGRLLKLDILGHDVPTIIKMLHDLTGVDPRTSDIADKDVVSLFTSPAALGVTERDINCKTGSLGLPEFGTNFVRGMLAETRPSSFAELVSISGLSHGTNVWLNNGADLIRQKIATLKEIIPTRDDIMVYLILKGVEKLDAFKIMENVRKGKGLTDEEEQIMLAANVPRWYIESCRKISYMFPKGHAVAYVMMTMRIGYFKIHHPAAFYAATFSVKSDDFNYELMCKGPETARAEMRRISALGNEATQKDEKSMVLLELVNEMYARGLTFAKLDIYRAHANKFQIVDGALMPPLVAVAGLGASVAEQFVTARADGEFFSIEDLKARTKVNKNVVQLLKDNGVLDGIPETEQMSLF